MARKRLEVAVERVLLEILMVGGDVIILNGIKYVVDRAEYVNQNCTKTILRRVK